MGVKSLEVILENLKNEILPTSEEVFLILKEATEIFISERNNLRLKSPIKVVGDIHGQFYDTLNMFSLMGDLPHSSYLFLGDYVDRGLNSVELILILLILKTLYKDKVYMLRGNHETRLLTSSYGFKKECIEKYNLLVYFRVCQLFQKLPISAVVDEKIFCVHGGISPNLSIDKIDCSDRAGEVTDLSDLTWGDPSEVNGFVMNPRGAGYLFGENEVVEFLKRNGLSMIVRSHQLVMNGYQSYYGDKLFTVWSAPNYMYRSENLACVMHISQGGYEFQLFDRCSRQYRILKPETDYF